MIGRKGPRMSKDFVKVYDASNAAEAEMIRQALEDAGIRAYIDTTPSPLDGLIAMGQGIPVLVVGDKADEAVGVIEELCERHGDADDETDDEPIDR
jgi:hypothetical protein